MRTLNSARQYRDVEYYRVGNQSLCLDAFVPASDHPVAAAIVVHGGGWVAGDRRTNVEPLLEALGGAGFAWFSISYTLASNITQFGTAFGDVEQAIKYVVSHASEYGVDPDRIFLVGESAGGQLASMAALRNGAAKLKAVVALYAPMDLEEAVRSTRYGNMLGPATMLLPRLRKLSPMRNIRPGMPPFLLIHGTEDKLVAFDQSLAMCRAIRAAGGSCDLISVRGGGHGLRWWESSSQTGYKRLMLDWLSRHVNGAHAA